MSGKIDMKGTLAVCGAMASWATAPLFIRFLSGYLDGWSQNFWRYLAAMLAALPFLLLTWRRGELPRGSFRAGLLPAAMNIIMQSFWAWSFYFINPGFSTLLSRSSLIWVTVISMLIFPAERKLLKSKRYWTGMSLCLAGVGGVIGFADNFTAEKNLTGIALMLTASLCWALYSVTAKRTLRNLDPRAGFAVISVYTTIGLGIIALAAGHPGRIAAMAPRPMLFLVISGIVCITCAHSFYYLAMHRLGVVIPALVLSLIPFVVLVLSRVVFGESLNLRQWLSGGVLIGGSVIATLAQEYLRAPAETINTTDAVRIPGAER